MLRQFTATCYVIQDDKVLLIYHKKFKKWLPPGGHIDPNETPPQAAKREVLEETGIEIEFFRQENILISESYARSIERPYLCMLQDIPAYKDQPAHQHMDMVFLGYPVGGKLIENEEETQGLKWFSQEELSKLTPEVDTFTEVLETIHHLFNQKLVVSV
jgi:8-oxo-dGTP pyrophosphatase MutT (NUDIX family)